MTAPNLGAGLIRNARTARGLTRQQLEARMGGAKNSVLPRETNPHPTIDLLERYGDALGYRLVVHYVDPDTGNIIEGDQSARQGRL